MSTATMASPWTKKASSNEGGDFELPPGGTYPAVMVALIDLGTHSEVFNNEAKDSHKILMAWELTGENDSKGRPFKVAKELTWSLNTKARLRGFLEGYAGRKFADDEEINLLSFMATQGVVNVTEGQSNNGRKFVDVASWTKPMRGLVVPPPSVEPFVWGFTDRDDKGNEISWNPNQDPPIPDWMPRIFGKTVVEKIKASSEWSKLVPF